jgi:cation diffusion facilitator family transporter
MQLLIGGGGHYRSIMSDGLPRGEVDSHHSKTEAPLRRLFHQGAHLLTHDHEEVDARDSGAVGIRATKVSLIGLGVTAAIQALIVVWSGSVALLSDTLHNVTDALTAIPLWMAFALGRRKATRTYTYGFGRVEDFAGLLIVGAIGLSAGLVVWESVQRLAEPRLIDHIPWVIAAGLIGAVGNELVARYRMSVGRAIGSEALVTDGHHARTDAWTSLAVVAAGVGAVFGVAWVDPVAGLVVAAGIVALMVRSARRVARRLLDGVEPAVVARANATIRGVPGVRDVSNLQARWHGHQIRIAASVAVDPQITVVEGHEVAHTVEHALLHAFSSPVVVVVHVDPHSHDDAHQTTAHHDD